MAAVDGHRRPSARSASSSVPGWDDDGRGAEAEGCGACRRHLGTRAGALSLFALAIGITAAGPAYIQSTIENDLRTRFVVDSPKAKAYQDWVDDTVNPRAPAIYFSMYLFNISNAPEFLLGAKPILQQLGPFLYRRYERKLNVTFGDDGNTAEYTQWRWYVEEPGNMARFTNVTTINMPFQAVRGLTEHLDLQWVLDLLYSKFSDRNALLVTKTAHEMLWGYPDPVLDGIHKLLPGMVEGRFPGLQQNLTNEAEVHSKRYGMGQYTGKNDSSLLQELYKWQGMDRVMCCLSGPCGPKGGPLGWGTDAAARVTGPVGAHFSPMQKRGGSVNVFVQSLYRYAHLLMASEYDYRGAHLFRYRIPPALMENQTLNPANAAYFADGPNGLLNVTACESKTPVFLSKPMFLDGDRALWDAVGGLPEPNRVEHDTVVDIEPDSGSVMHAEEKLMASIYLTPAPAGFGRVFYPKVEPVYLPLFWLNEHGEATDKMVSDVLDLYSFQQLETTLQWAGTAGCLAAIALLVWSCAGGDAPAKGGRRRRKQTEYAELSDSAGGP